MTWLLWVLAYLAVGSLVGGFAFADMLRGDPEHERVEKNVGLTIKVIFLWPLFGPVLLATTLGEWLVRRTGGAE